MKCDRCKKAHATLHVVTCEKGAHQEAHLCDGCARKVGFDPLNFTVGSLLGHSKKAPKMASRRRSRTIRCPGCGMTIAEIQNLTRVGCARCYDTFREDFDEFMEMYHKDRQHRGKVPTTVSSTIKKEAELGRLKDYLEVIVKKEDYEEAAQIRDRIKRLEESLRGAEG